MSKVNFLVRLMQPHCLLRTARRAEKAFRGFQAIELALLLPLLLGIAFALMEPLFVMHRYNSTYHQVTEIVNDAREMAELQGDFWSGDQAAYDAFKSNRQQLSDKLAAGVASIGGVSLKKVKHLDRFGATERWVELDIGYLPPLTSAVVDGWELADGKPASLNNTHVCAVIAESNEGKEEAELDALQLHDAAFRMQGGRSGNDSIPLDSSLGERGKCNVKAVPASEMSKWKVLQSVSTLAPTEVTVVADIRGIFGSYPMAITVPYWPRLAEGREISCQPNWTVGAWSEWSSSCGQGTRTRTDSDSCRTSRTLSEARCASCSWTRTGQGQCSNSCGHGTRSYTETSVECGESRTLTESCITRCPKLCDNGEGLLVNSGNHRSSADQCNTSCHWASKNFIPSQGQGGQMETCAVGECNAPGTRDDSLCSSCRYYVWSDQSCDGAGAGDIDQKTGTPITRQPILCTNGIGYNYDSIGNCNTSCHWNGFSTVTGDGTPNRACLQIGRSSQATSGCRSGADNSLCTQCVYWQWSNVGCNGTGASDINQNTGQPN